MSYVVLARKWRPQTFADLVGQEHVSRTLQNAINSGRIAHAFLFTGVRGVGKTTSARILAKALNCLRPGDTSLQQDQGPTAEPCGTCSACREIAEGRDLDVQEIDGASYTGVDDIRRLQSSLQHHAARDRYKIYIVDEVHMLSGPAWNAFLKTLEEPPAHVKFILATTEVHKVPITILSRVQRFDFRMISLAAIVERLRFVLAQEKIPAEDAALSLLAREAAGSMRDAMSLLDQVLAYDAKQIKAADVAMVLGVASHQVLYGIAGSLLSGDAQSCVKAISDLGNQGFSISSVARDLLSLLRDLVVAKVCSGADDLVDLPDAERQDVQRLATGAVADDLIRLHLGFSRSFDDVVRSGQPQAALEMLLIRLARRPPLVPIDEWLARLNALEARLGGAPPASVPSSGVGGASGSPSKRSASAAAPSAPAQAERAEPTKAEAAPVVPAGSASNLQLWSDLLDKLRDSRPELASLAQHVLPVTLSAAELVLGVETGSIFATTLAAPDAQAALQRVAAEHFGQVPKLTFRTFASLGSQPTLAQLSAEARLERQKEASERARQHPRVQEALQILGARIKDVRPAED